MRNLSRDGCRERERYRCRDEGRLEARCGHRDPSRFGPDYADHSGCRDVSRNEPHYLPRRPGGGRTKDQVKRQSAKGKTQSAGHRGSYGAAGEVK